MELYYRVLFIFEYVCDTFQRSGFVILLFLVLTVIFIIDIHRFNYFVVEDIQFRDRRRANDIQLRNHIVDDDDDTKRRKINVNN